MGEQLASIIVPEATDKGRRFRTQRSTGFIQPTDGQVDVFSAASGKWVPGLVPAASIAVGSANSVLYSDGVANAWSTTPQLVGINDALGNQSLQLVTGSSYPTLRINGIAQLVPPASMPSGLSLISLNLTGKSVAGNSLVIDAFDTGGNITNTGFTGLSIYGTNASLGVSGGGVLEMTSLRGALTYNTSTLITTARIFHARPSSSSPQAGSGTTVGMEISVHGSAPWNKCRALLIAPPRAGVADVAAARLFGSSTIAPVAIEVTGGLGASYSIIPNLLGNDIQLLGDSVTELLIQRQHKDFVETLVDPTSKGHMSVAPFAGTLAGGTNLSYVVEIQVGGAYDGGQGSTVTYRWSKDGGATWVASNISLHATNELLDNNINVAFSAETYTALDRWAWTAIAASNKVTLLQADTNTDKLTLRNVYAMGLHATTPAGTLQLYGSSDESPTTGLISLVGLTARLPNTIWDAALNTRIDWTTATDFKLNGDVSTNTLAGQTGKLTVAGLLTASAGLTVTGTTILNTALGIAYGGTGQVTAQAAIDALSAVSGATNEYVLTKDTATGNALYKAVPAGGSMATDVLWDAAGDLAVGTGADTGAKLTLTVPAAGVRNLLSVNNGETTPTWQSDALWPLLLGRAGGQTLYGGTAANENLILGGTSHATHTTSIVSVLDHLRMASAKDIQDSGGTARITLATASIQTKITGDASVSGRAIIGGTGLGGGGSVLELGGTLTVADARYLGINATINAGANTRSMYGICCGPTLSAATFAATTARAVNCSPSFTNGSYTEGTSFYIKPTLSLGTASGYVMTALRGLYIYFPAYSGLDAGTGITTALGIDIEDQGNAGVGTAIGLRVLTQSAAATANIAIDCQGALANEESTITLAAAPGTAVNLTPGDTSFVRITGPTSNFTVVGIKATYANGQHLVILNDTAVVMTIANESASATAAADRINTNTAASVVTSGFGTFHLIYSAAKARWVFVSPVAP